MGYASEHVEQHKVQQYKVWDIQTGETGQDTWKSRFLAASFRNRRTVCE